jgi:hypothetical protein
LCISSRRNLVDPPDVTAYHYAFTGSSHLYLPGT